MPETFVLLRVVSFLAILLVTPACSSLKRLAIVEASPGIFEGSKPSTTAHFDTLRAHGVRTILSLDQLPWDIIPERRAAQRNGFAYRNVPILASPLKPREKRVDAALLILGDPSLRPIFVHCLLGRDRTAFLIGLYRVHYLGWTPQAAWDEMLRSGFNVRWSLRGFSDYFWQHAGRPQRVKVNWDKPP